MWTCEISATSAREVGRVDQVVAAQVGERGGQRRIGEKRTPSSVIATVA